MKISTSPYKRLAALAACLLALQAAGAQPSDAPRDYTHSMPLTVGGKQGVAALRLPQAVYLHARSAALADVRVFDAAGARVAFALHTPPPEPRSERRILPVRIFPLKSSRPRGAADAFDLDIRTGADGALLSVKTRPATGAGAAQEALTGLVLDLSHSQGEAERPLIDALRFTLPTGVAAYSAQVWLETSDDLRAWQTVGAADLQWLVNADGQTLASDRLEFEPRSFRYARLSWRKGEPLLFAALAAETVRPGAGPALDSLLLQPQPGPQAGDLVYRSALALPVERAGLEFAEANAVLPAALGEYRARPAERGGREFHPHLRATFYQIQQQGQTRRSGDLALPVTHSAQWVLRPQGETDLKPALRLSWQPATLVFLASGREPYTLAFGRDGAAPAQLALSQVAPGFSAQELARLEPAAAGPLQANAAPPDDGNWFGAPRRVLILWAVLLAGVAVLAAMGWRLARQMR
jgi:hypothetical protein